MRMIIEASKEREREGEKERGGHNGEANGNV